MGRGGTRGPTYALEAFCANAGNALGLLPTLGFAPDGRRPTGRGRIRSSSPRPRGSGRRTGTGRIGSPSWARAAPPPPPTWRRPPSPASRTRSRTRSRPSTRGAADVLRVGGGLSAHEGLLQAVADLSGLTLEVAAEPEATARGIAALAAEAAGLLDEAAAAPEIARTVVPRLDEDGRARERSRWAEALEVHMRVEA